MMYLLLVLGGPAVVVGIVAIRVRKSHRRLVVWWMSTAVALAISIWFTASAVTEARRMEARWMIYLPVVFIPVALATAFGAIQHTRLRRRAVAPDGTHSVAHA